MKREQTGSPPANPKAEPRERSVCSGGAVRLLNLSCLRTSFLAAARELSYRQREQQAHFIS